MFEKFFVLDMTPADPPKSPLKRETLRNLAPLIKGGLGGSGLILILFKQPLILVMILSYYKSMLYLFMTND